MALNFQTAGVEMDLNDGLFSQNARCGYVLKPAFMRHAHTRFDPEHPQNRDGYTPLALAVQVHLSFRLSFISKNKQTSVHEKLTELQSLIQVLSRVE